MLNSGHPNLFIDLLIYFIQIWAFNYGSCFNDMGEKKNSCVDS